MSAAFSAALLAGGRSRRMGRDKALLPLPGGRALWQRQLDDVLRPLGAAELFFCGPGRAGLPGDVAVLADRADDAGRGPLAGIAAALGALRDAAPLLVVLAVDLPAMTAEFFQERLLPRCRPGCGIVPRVADGFFEPLAAVYPRECLPLARERLRGVDLSLQSFVRAAQAAGWLETVAIRESERPLFANWNTPADLGGQVSR